MRMGLLLSPHCLRLPFSPPWLPSSPFFVFCCRLSKIDFKNKIPVYHTGIGIRTDLWCIHCMTFFQNSELTVNTKIYSFSTIMWPASCKSSHEVNACWLVEKLMLREDGAKLLCKCSSFFMFSLWIWKGVIPTSIWCLSRILLLYVLRII